MTRDECIGRTIKAARGARGWSSNELARRVGCDPSTVLRAEAGRIVWPALCEIAQALRLRLSALILLSEEMQSDFEAVAKSQDAVAKRIAGELS